MIRQCGYRPRVRALACAVAALAAAAGCQTYEPRPLDPAEHREAWHARTLENSSVEPFLERMARVDGDGAPAFDPADGLTLGEGRIFALVYNPRLRVARLRAERAAATAEHAGRWDDPELAVGVLRIAENLPERWVVSPEPSLTIPLSGRLGAEKDLAEAERRAAVLEAVETEWDVLHDVRKAWNEWSAARLRVQETERLVTALDELVENTSGLAEAGEVQRVEASLFAMQRAQRRNELTRLRGEAAAAEQRIRGHLGLPPDAPLRLVPSLLAGAADTEGPDEIAGRNPALARLRVAYEVSEQNLRHEVLKQYPDLTLGPAYELDEGDNKFGFGLGIPLPILNANEGPIAEARVDRELARAAYETQYEMLVGTWAAADAEARSLVAQRTDMERTLVPLVDRQLADAVRLLDLGEGDILVLLESVESAHETKLDFIDARLAEANARAEIEHLVGPRAAEGAGDGQEDMQ